MDEAKMIVDSLSRNKERLIKNAIDHKMESKDWRIEDLTGRGEIKICPDKSEIFAFDGVDLIWFSAPKTEIDSSVKGIYLRTVQEYQLLYSNTGD